MKIFEKIQLNKDVELEIWEQQPEPPTKNVQYHIKLGNGIYYNVNPIITKMVMDIISALKKD
ncbi:hypothetical protein [uncultured Arcobacter sp.]|uniref:hypothetical protein n=1 Tax=uncultured Arcobacter sp. TaxID=165434 RepID=UPI002614942E|nr:hypothetical protein [uncultured Arcobacter sp.]